MFQASSLSDGDFFWLVADSAAESVQYGHRKAVCQAVLAAAPNLRAEAFANFTVNFFYAVLVFMHHRQSYVCGLIDDD